MKRQILYVIGCTFFIAAFIFMMIICGGLDSDQMTFSHGVIMALADIAMYFISYTLIETNREEDLWE